MTASLVMTILGEDKPGLVESIASLVAEQGGNWVESRMSRLGGQFAGILRVEVPAQRRDVLIEALRDLQARGLTVVVHSDGQAPAVRDETVCTLEIVGQDRPGIVREISRALARRGVNVEELDTERVSAAMSGELMFRARAKIKLPADCSAAELRKDLERIGHDLIVDISLQELAAPASAWTKP
jgi:glycine cleavage system regulatory protein